ncbi:MAG: dihydropteroate synthase [Candidatus Eisenbacteria bacterium]|uniref:dihydropteroate synthase n=1 Tax=Eiseniibacteriota bacterium TaxID=2212470 RepID=A0A956RPG5_UNCEI|nr:dihydropteroate synthase [Candidatus Eisenbacteria bacterium]
MGILNCTPDSFSDGGVHTATGAAVDRLHAMIEEGADWIDIGGESTRPGAPEVPWTEEWRRIEPVLREAARDCAIPVSVDTTKPEVAARALDLGVSIVNDVSGLQFAPELADLAASSGAALILMHMRGTPRTMQTDPRYDDVTREVVSVLEESCALARAHGVPPDQLVVDPGIGFGKTGAHNYTLLRELPALARLGCPILIGASRKSFLARTDAGKPTGSPGLPVDERIEASLAAHVAAALAGAHIVRVHDVRATVRALRIADEIADLR